MTDNDEIKSEEELLTAFRQRDQARVILPKKNAYPLSFEWYLSWVDPSGVYRYLVFRRPGTKKLAGIVFKRSSSGAFGRVTQLCDWCHAYGDQIDLLTVSPSSKKTVGLILCEDLSCIEKIEMVGRTTRKSFDRMAEELCQKIDRFYESTFIARQD